VNVDGSRLLPEAEMDVRLLGGEGGLGRRRELGELEGRLNAFGYSFHAPFLTNCSLEVRRRAGCPAVGGRAR
jgi:hypothetical protein